MTAPVLTKTMLATLRYELLAAAPIKELSWITSDLVDAVAAGAEGKTICVPAEPTEAMLKAATKAEPGLVNIYRAMIAAAQEDSNGKA